LHLVLTLNLGVAGHQLLGLLQQGGDRHTCAHQHRLGAIGLLEHGHQQMGWLDIGLIGTQDQGLGIGQGLLKFGGQFFNTHGTSLGGGMMAQLGLIALISSLAARANKAAL